MSPGLVVDQDALVKALQSGTIRAAALDVTHPEPLPRSQHISQANSQSLSFKCEKGTFAFFLFELNNYSLTHQDLCYYSLKTKNVVYLTILNQLTDCMTLPESYILVVSL